MTREEAKIKLFQSDDLYNMKGFNIGEDNPRYERCELSQYKVGKLINQIFDEHEAQLKDKDEEIDRLKEHITHLQNVYMKLDGKYLKLKTELEELKDDK